MVFGDPTGSFLVVVPRVARACQLARAGVSPVALWSDSSNVGWALVSNPFGVSEWTLILSVFSAASVKLVGVARPVRIHTFSPLLSLFFSFPRSHLS